MISIIFKQYIKGFSWEDFVNSDEEDDKSDSGENSKNIIEEKQEICIYKKK